MAVVLSRLGTIPKADIIRLMTNPRVLRHMPLAREPFDDAACDGFVRGKEGQWSENGYGPWAFIVDGRFAGWGGFQKEGEDADLGLVLDPAFWGRGPEIYRQMLDIGFRKKADGGMGFPSVIILLPPSRKRLNLLKRLGFQPEGAIDYLGETFLKFRKMAPAGPPA